MLNRARSSYACENPTFYHVWLLIGLHATLLLTIVAPLMVFAAVGGMLTVIAF